MLLIIRGGGKKEYNYRKHEYHKSNHVNYLSSPRSTSQMHAGLAPFWLPFSSREGIRICHWGLSSRTITFSAKSVDLLQLPKISFVLSAQIGCRSYRFSSWGCHCFGWIPTQKTGPLSTWALSVIWITRKANQGMVRLIWGTQGSVSSQEDKTSPCHCLTLINC